MLISELFNLPPEKINEITSKLLIDHFDIDLIGYILTLDIDRLEECIKYPDEYEIGSTIKRVYLELNTIREDEINNGAKLTDQELDYLKEGLLDEQGEDGLEGVNYMSLNIICNDGEVLAAFSGASIPGGADWSFFGLYKSRNELIGSLKINLEADERFFNM